MPETAAGVVVVVLPGRQRGRHGVGHLAAVGPLPLAAATAAAEGGHGLRHGGEGHLQPVARRGGGRRRGGRGGGGAAAGGGGRGGVASIAGSLNTDTAQRF